VIKRFGVEAFFPLAIEPHAFIETYILLSLFRPRIQTGTKNGFTGLNNTASGRYKYPVNFPLVAADRYNYREQSLKGNWSAKPQILVSEVSL
jgi:hypothetical protein